MTKQTTDKLRKNSDGRKRRLANLKPWPRGVSGNPKGRPKSITLSEAYRRTLAEMTPDAPEETMAERIARSLIAEALKGNVQAIREIADRTEGRPQQKVDVDMTVADWRELAKAHGLSEEDVIQEAQRLIESSSLASSEESD